MKAIVKFGQDRVELRPVQLKDGVRLQAVSQVGTQAETKNLTFDEIEALVLGRAEELRSCHVRLEDREWSVAFSRKGRPVVSEKMLAVAETVDLRHDREVSRLLPEGQPDPFLIDLGLMNSDGRIKADKMRKFRQINEFLRIVSEALDLKLLGEEPLLIVDFGCGQAYLTLALHHYLTQKLGQAAEFIGVDRNPNFIEIANARASAGISFVPVSIAEFVSPRPPSIVVALHACDTATDDVIAKAITSGAKAVFLAPCCHHHLQAQLAGVRPENEWSGLLGFPLVRERFGDLVTDTLRALTLRMRGYEVDMIEFTSPVHTPRNLMIRAVWTGRMDLRAETEYEALKLKLGVTPYLEQALS